jgi:hypothetical protein
MPKRRKGRKKRTLTPEQTLERERVKQLRAALARHRLKARLSTPETESERLRLRETLKRIPYGLRTQFARAAGFRNLINCKSAARHWMFERERERVHTAINDLESGRLVLTKRKVGRPRKQVGQIFRESAGSNLKSSRIFFPFKP